MDPSIYMVGACLAGHSRTYVELGNMGRGSKRGRGRGKVRGGRQSSVGMKHETSSTLVSTHSDINPI